MSAKILLVDDDANLLSACERNLRRQFQIETAQSGEAGLAKIEERGPFGVVVADRQMPGMDGVQFLGMVSERAPDTVRMMLTGNADLEGIIRLVNESNIFRFLTKPCPPEVLAKALHDAEALYQLAISEKELLNKTLSGSIKLLTDILSMVETQSFGRAQQLRDAIGIAADRLGLDNAWEIHLAVMLAPIGNVTVPPETLVRSRAGHPLSEVEEQMMAHVPETAARLLANIPRLEGVARIVRYQDKCFDGSGFPLDDVSGESIPLGARLLKILLDIMEFQRNGVPQAEALERMRTRTGLYDPALLKVLKSPTDGRAPSNVQAANLSIEVGVNDLVKGMVLRSNMETKEGTLILPAGHQISEMTLIKIRNFDSVVGIKTPILVGSVATS
ncbi:MAG TPA: HD domain-containing phosphohydrolase [Verrucomicrobiae bacterium]|jgi:response regulator RpfG family c-di-GMP phosphodiesterase|nr:HD domain-containing phosphohydrolase [Verrucomicrobiae bacterium]